MGFQPMASAPNTPTRRPTAPPRPRARCPCHDQSSALIRTNQYCYNPSRRQIIEVRDGSDNVERVRWTSDYGTQYIDEIVCMDVNEDADTDPLESTDSRYFVHQDATWNVLCLTQGRGDNKGSIVEYYQYDPYGRRQVFVDDEDSNGKAWGHQVLASTVGNVLGHKGRWHEPATGKTSGRTAVRPTCCPGSAPGRRRALLAAPRTDGPRTPVNSGQRYRPRGLGVSGPGPDSCAARSLHLR